MTQEEFQKVVIESLAKLNDRMDTHEKLLHNLEEFTCEQKEVNRKQEAFNRGVQEFIREQKEFNRGVQEFIREQKEFNRGLHVLIEQEVCERLAAIEDGLKMYAENKVKEHEMQYHLT